MKPRNPRIQALFDSAVIWDNHGCMPLTTRPEFLPQLERYRAAGTHVVALNVGYGEMSLIEHLRVLSYMRQWISKASATCRLVSTVQDIQQCKADQKLGIFFDVEGMYPVQDDLSFVQTFYELGVRWMLIAYNRNNKAGGGCLDEDTGLTATGRAIIDEMQRVGMLLCLSHTGARTAAEALEYSSTPPLFSHSNPAACTAHPRNVSDDLLRACARKGGVIGMNGYGPFLGNGANIVEELLRHLRYTIDLVGAEHVGLGLDYVFDRSELDEHIRNYPGSYPPGTSSARDIAMVEPEAMSAIVEGLCRDGLTDGEIQGVLGGNLLRLASQVWK